MIDNGAAGSALSFASVLTHSDNGAYLASCLRPNNSPPLIFNDQSGTSYDLGTLNYNAIGI